MVLRPSNCRWALHLSESYLHSWRHAVSEEVEIGSFDLTYESFFGSGFHKIEARLQDQLAQAKLSVFSVER